jgi:hypothetical protein
MKMTPQLLALAVLLLFNANRLFHNQIRSLTSNLSQTPMPK